MIKRLHASLAMRLQNDNSFHKRSSGGGEGFTGGLYSSDDFQLLDCEGNFLLSND